jgi:hypothetical protein
MCSRPQRVLLPSPTTQYSFLFLFLFLKSLLSIVYFLFANLQFKAMFYIGSNVLDWPLEAQRAVADGHEVCVREYPFFSFFLPFSCRFCGFFFGLPFFGGLSSWILGVRGVCFSRLGALGAVDASASHHRVPAGSAGFARQDFCTVFCSFSCCHLFSARTDARGARLGRAMCTTHDDPEPLVPLIRWCSA